MNKFVFIAALLCTSPAVAASIDAAKARPAKSTMVTSMDRAGVLRCLRLTFDGASINEIDNPDGSTDVTTAIMGHRFSLWSIRPSADGLIVEGRGQHGGGLRAEAIAKCASPSA